MIAKKNYFQFLANLMAQWKEKNVGGVEHAMSLRDKKNITGGSYGDGYVIKDTCHINGGTGWRVLCKGGYSGDYGKKTREGL